MHRQIDAIQMGTHNISLYKEVDEKYTGCNLKTAELLDCALIGVCVVIKSNTVVLEKDIFLYCPIKTYIVGTDIRTVLA